MGERGIPTLTPLQQREYKTLDSTLIYSSPSCLMVLNERWKEGTDEGRDSERTGWRGRPFCESQFMCRVAPHGTPLPSSHVSMATYGPCLGQAESGSDGGDLRAFRLAHYVGNEVKQPGGAFVLRGLPLSCQRRSIYRNEMKEGERGAAGH